MNPAGTAAVLAALLAAAALPTAAAAFFYLRWGRARARAADAQDARTATEEAFAAYRGTAELTVAEAAEALARARREADAAQQQQVTTALRAVADGIWPAQDPARPAEPTPAHLIEAGQALYARAAPTPTPTPTRPALTK